MIYNPSLAQCGISESEENMLVAFRDYLRKRAQASHDDCVLGALACARNVLCAYLRDEQAAESGMAFAFANGCLINAED